jgi:S-formylglutathione hydrolase
MTLTIRSTHACFGGTMGFYTHPSIETKTDMRFSVFVPDAARHKPLPALYFLAGLTCSEETFMVKAGAQRYATEHGVILVACDTSPRDLNIAGDSESWDFGVGAGFYLDATQAPWANNYRMGSYINQELPEFIEAHFPVCPYKRGIFGHSMGGHGALVTALRHPERWHSVSAFAPIANPSAVPWGEKAFGHYLGSGPDTWQAYDASVLMAKSPHPSEILIDQGLSDQFIDNQLHPAALEVAATQSGQRLRVRRHTGFDHSYWFIQTFVADHIAHHARIIRSLA